jgi:hypothetical protein
VALREEEKRRGTPMRGKSYTKEKREETNMREKSVK